MVVHHTVTVSQGNDQEVEELSYLTSFLSVQNAFAVEGVLLSKEAYRKVVELPALPLPF